MKYKVGDYVTIREWDDMEAEFGLDAVGRIRVPYNFTKLMRRTCGQTLRVRRVHSDTYYLSDVDWMFSEEMFEPENLENNITITADELAALLGVQNNAVTNS